MINLRFIQSFKREMSVGQISSSSLTNNEFVILVDSANWAENWYLAESNWIAWLTLSLETDYNHFFYGFFWIAWSFDGSWFWHHKNPSIGTNCHEQNYFKLSVSPRNSLEQQIKTFGTEWMLQMSAFKNCICVPYLLSRISLVTFNLSVLLLSQSQFDTPNQLSLFHQLSLLIWSKMFTFPGWTAECTGYMRSWNRMRSYVHAHSHTRTERNELERPHKYLWCVDIKQLLINCWLIRLDGNVNKVCHSFRFKST